MVGKQQDYEGVTVQWAISASG